MQNPYTPVERSTAEAESRYYVPCDSENVPLLFGGEGVGDSRFVIENSRNEYAWIEAVGGDSFEDLAEMR